MSRSHGHGRGGRRQQEGDDSIDCRGGARAGARAGAPGVSRSDVNPTVRALVSWISWGLLPF